MQFRCSAEAASTRINALSKLTLQTSRLVPVALVSLGLLLASPAGAASMTESERCNWKADKVETRYSKCLSRSTTRLSNVLDGSTLDEDLHCAEQFYRSMDVIERRATFKDVGPACEARLTPESQACTQAAALIVAGRDLGDYRPQFDDLSLEDLACSPIQAYLQDSYDDGYEAGYDDGEASVDITSDNAGVAAESYSSGYSDGQESVDITSDNAAIASTSYATGYSDGQESVDITSDNAAVASASYATGYFDGQESVDITSDNAAQYDAGYSAGQASVDITTDNETIANDAYALGYAEGTASCAEVPDENPGTCGSLAIAGGASAGRVLIPASAVPAYGDAFTVEAWFRLDLAADEGIHEYAQIFAHGWPPNQLAIDVKHTQPSGPVTPTLRIGSHRLGAYEVWGSTTVSDQTWHHVAAVFDHGEVRIYLDGEQVSSGEGYQSPGSSLFGEALAIGDANLQFAPDEPCCFGDYTFPGSIDEVRLSNVVRYSATFTPAGRHAVDSDTVLLLHFDEGGVTTAVDSGIQSDVVGTLQGPGIGINAAGPTCGSQITCADGECLGVFDAATWDEADSFCESWGGQLATIRSESKNEAVRAAVGSGSAYIGLHEGGGPCNRHYCWVDDEYGSPNLPYSAWAPGEPTEVTCAYMEASDGLWRSGTGVGCYQTEGESETRRFVCERPDTSAAAKTSCSDWRASGSTTSGVYAIQPDGESEIDVYCDMTTDGGGWTRVLGHVTGVETEYSDMAQGLAAAGAMQGHLGHGALKDLRQSMGFDEIRFLCTKESHSRKVHIASDAVSVLDFFAGDAGRPSSSGTVIRMSDDTSILGTDPSRWDGGKWGHDRHRGIDHHAFYTPVEVHWLPGQTRWECDDYVGDGATFGTQGQWEVFVR